MLPTTTKKLESTKKTHSLYMMYCISLESEIIKHEQVEKIFQKIKATVHSELKMQSMHFFYDHNISPNLDFYFITKGKINSKIINKIQKQIERYFKKGKASLKIISPIHSLACQNLGTTPCEYKLTHYFFKENSDIEEIKKIYKRLAGDIDEKTNALYMKKHHQIVECDFIDEQIKCLYVFHKIPLFNDEVHLNSTEEEQVKRLMTRLNHELIQPYLDCKSKSQITYLVSCPSYDFDSLATCYYDSFHYQRTLACLRQISKFDPDYAAIQKSIKYVQGQWHKARLKQLFLQKTVPEYHNKKGHSGWYQVSKLLDAVQIRRLNNTDTKVKGKGKESITEEGYESDTEQSQPGVTNREYLDIMRRRQVRAEQLFFDPQRTHSQQSKKLASRMLKNRLHTQPSQRKSIIATNIPTRRLITAERATLQASLNFYGRQQNERTPQNLGWHAVGENYPEKVILGSSTFQYHQSERAYGNHLGNYRMDRIGKYNHIISEIDSITGSKLGKPNKQNEKRLALYMLRYTRNGKPLTLSHLKKIKSNATKKDLDLLNKLFYHLFVKEPARRMLPLNRKQHEFPYAIIQARALQLVRHGYLCMRNVFGLNANYGPVTVEAIYKKTGEVRERVDRVNEKYNRSRIIDGISHRNSNNFRMFKENVSGSFYPMPTCKCFHKELQDTYGGNSDTDSEGYSSDEADYSPTL